MRRVLLVLALGLAASPALAAGGPTAGTGSRAYFVSGCGYSHHAPNDPIVYPREPGFSHDHTFVGNVSTNAFSTLATLRAASSTCYLYGDTAAYWAPTLLLNGSPVLPRAATIYYRRDTVSRVRPFPPGLRMVAGDSHAVRPQSPAVTYWDCSVVKESFYGRRLQSAASSSTIPRCSSYSDLQLVVNFPDCWNGKTLDSPDHKHHMAYSVGGRCPASHPVAVPELSLVYTYLPPGPGVTMLSSGGQFSGHADFVNSWNQRALTALVNDCLNRNRVCGLGAVSSSAR